MLKLKIKHSDPTIHIGDSIVVHVLERHRSYTVLGIDAPRDVRVRRGLHLKIDEMDTLCRPMGELEAGLVADGACVLDDALETMIEHE